MIRVKDGVTPANLIIAAAAANSAEDMKTIIYITSGTDGKHKENSLHYTGAALDFRTSNLTKEQVTQFMAKMKARLGKDYDVILEVDHIHIEKDPK